MQRLTFFAQTSSGGDSALTDSVDGLARHRPAPVIR